MQDRSDSLNELVTALIAAQKAMKPALKSTKGGRGMYVNLEHAWDACKEALWDNGLTVIQTSRVGEGGKGYLVTTLAHTSGQWISGEYPLRPAKANDPQMLGATVTYARRYALMAIVGLAPEDDDGEMASRGGYRGRERAADDRRPAAGPPQQRNAPASAEGGPRLGQPSEKSKARWGVWLEKILTRWAATEPVVDEADFHSRENRIAQALITSAGPEIERLVQVPGKDPGTQVRDHRKVWETVHKLCAGDFEWVKQATLDHLKKHVKEDADPRPAAMTN